MDMTGERRIPAPRDRVWRALLDAQVLSGCIPGCRSLEWTSDRELAATIDASVGSLSLPLTGRLTLSDVDQPNGLTLTGSAEGDGSAQASAAVTLQDEGPFTLLRYRVQGRSGGRLASLGAQATESAFARVVGQFLDRFTAEVASPEEILADGPAGAVAALSNTSARRHNPPALVTMLAAVPSHPYGYPLAAWIGGAAYLVVFALIFSAYL